MDLQSLGRIFNRPAIGHVSERLERVVSASEASSRIAQVLWAGRHGFRVVSAGLPDGHDCEVELPRSRARGYDQKGRGTARRDSRVELFLMVLSEQRRCDTFSAPWRRSGEAWVGELVQLAKDKGDLAHSAHARRGRAETSSTNI